MIQRSLPLVILILLSTFSQTLDAAPLSNGDLRRLGYNGNYRGDVRGTVTIKDGSEFGSFFVDQRTREQLPPRNRSVVTGPSGRNGFFLNLRSVSGNDRRATIRYYYSGISFNPDYDEDTVASGVKVLKVLRRGSSRPQFEMNLTDKISERSADDGELYTYWAIRGRLFK